MPAVRTSYFSSVLVSLTIWIQNFISMICNLSKSQFAYEGGSWVRVCSVMSMSMCTVSSSPLICTMASLLLSFWIRYKETSACGPRKCCHFYDKTSVATSAISFKCFKIWELTVIVLQFLCIVSVITVKSVIITLLLTQNRGCKYSNCLSNNTVWHLRKPRTLKFYV